MRLGVVAGCGGHEHLALDLMRSVRRVCPPGSFAWVTFDGFEPERSVAAALDDLGVGYTCHDEQRGISAVWNRGIAEALEAGCEVIVVSNDDVRLPAGFAEAMTGCMRRHPQIRMLSALDRMTARTIVPWVGAEFDEQWSHGPLDADVRWHEEMYPGGLDAFAARFGDTRPEMAPCRMNGACFALSRRCVEEDAVFWEQLEPPGLFEDIDYYLRLLTRHGPGSLGMCTRTFVSHLRAVTLSALPRARSQAAAERNHALFEARWPRERWGSVRDWLCGSGGEDLGVNALEVGRPLPPVPGGG